MDTFVDDVETYLKIHKVIIKKMKKLYTLIEETKRAPTQNMVEDLSKNIYKKVYKWRPWNDNGYGRRR